MFKLAIISLLTQPAVFSVLSTEIIKYFPKVDPDNFHKVCPFTLIQYIYTRIYIFM